MIVKASKLTLAALLHRRFASFKSLSDSCETKVNTLQLGRLYKCNVSTVGNVYYFDTTDFGLPVCFASWRAARATAVAKR